MAPWVHRVFIELLPRVLCLERPKKEDKEEEVLTDVFQVPADLDKFTDYGTKRFSGEYGIPGTCQLIRKRPSTITASVLTFTANVPSPPLAVLPPSRFDVAAAGGIGPCFGEPPLPALPLPGGDDDLFSPNGHDDMSPTCCADMSPTFEKPILREVEKTIEASRFVAQHMKNKDRFESVSSTSTAHLSI